MTRLTGLAFLTRVVGALAVIAIVVAGIWSQNGTAAADPGDATAESGLTVIQKDIQIIAGNEETEENSSQSASNMLTGSQDSTAMSGDAIGGYATARSYGVVLQMNIQVIAGWNCSAHQTAANVAALDQEATATGGIAINLGLVNQTNTQIYVCPGLDGGESQQTAANLGSLSQTAEATSGTVINVATLNEANRQLTVD